MTEWNVNNPLIEQRADPWIYKHTDGYYYFTASVPEYDRIELRRSATVAGLADAQARTIWVKHETGLMSANIWAPELHFIEGKWYVYYAAAHTSETKEGLFDHRMFALENGSANPLEGEWTERGQVKTKWETFCLDATSFEHKGIRYYVWAQKEPGIAGNSNLYISEMENPWTLKGEPVRLTIPEYDWETRGYRVNEGAEVLIRGGKEFMAYTGSATDDRYCMGLLTAAAASDLLNPASWTKSSVPVFESSEENGIYGPGHNSFTVSEDGKRDLLVFHARSYKDVEGDPLYDPNRHTRVQPLGWNEDGTPDFGVPLADSRKAQNAG